MQEPHNYTEAKENVAWIEAMKTDIAVLENNETWEIVDLPARKRPIGCRWVYKVKLQVTAP